jgi:hypothetical protein
MPANQPMQLLRQIVFNGHVCSLGGVTSKYCFNNSLYSFLSFTGRSEGRPCLVTISRLLSRETRPSAVALLMMLPRVKLE